MNQVVKRDREKVLERAKLIDAIPVGVVCRREVPSMTLTPIGNTSRRVSDILIDPRWGRWL